MRQRHKLMQSKKARSSAASKGRSDRYEVEDDQSEPVTGKAKKRATHQLYAEGARPKHRLDKVRRGGRSAKRYEDGGTAGGTAGSTRSPNDPGGEIAAANKGRKSALDWVRDEVLGGPKSAYAGGGRQRPKRYDAGGAAPPGGGATLPSGGSNLPTSQDFSTTQRINPIRAFVQANIPPLDRYISLNPPPNGPNLQPKKGSSGSKKGGRIGQGKPE